MARYYGTVQGGRGQASRLGHATTGLRLQAMSHDGDVVVDLHSEGVTDHVCISVRPHGRYGASKTIYAGPVSDLLEHSARKTMLQALAGDALLHG